MKKILIGGLAGGLVVFVWGAEGIDQFVGWFLGGLVIAKLAKPSSSA